MKKDVLSECKFKKSRIIILISDNITLRQKVLNEIKDTL